jgi:hypothetical protein
VAGTIKASKLYLLTFRSPHEVFNTYLPTIQNVLQSFEIMNTSTNGTINVPGNQSQQPQQPPLISIPVPANANDTEDDPGTGDGDDIPITDGRQCPPGTEPNEVDECVSIGESHPLLSPLTPPEETPMPKPLSEPEEESECPLGQIVDEASGVCVDEGFTGEDVEDKLPPLSPEVTEDECPEGQIVDEASGVCVDENEELLPFTPEEEPLPPLSPEVTEDECPEGQIVDEASGVCVDEGFPEDGEDQLPPLDQLPPSPEILQEECPAGQILDEVSGECIEEEFTGEVDQPSPETQEICDNGIDDDGDMLVDTEDIENCSTASDSTSVPEIETQE